MRRKVLVVTNYLYPPQIAVWREARALGVDLHLVGTTDWFWPVPGLQGRPTMPEWRPVHDLHPIGWRRRGHLWWWYRGLRDVFRAAQPEIVHVISEPWGTLPQQARTLHAPALVLHGSATVYHQGHAWESPVRRALARSALRHASGFAAASAEAVDMARAHGLGAVPTAVAQHLVPDPAPFHAASLERDRHRRVLGFDATDVVVGLLGRLVPEKGFPWLLESLEGLDDKRIRIVVFGEGPHRDEFEALARASAQRVEIRERVPLEDVPSVCAALDIVVVPSLDTSSWSEYFGRVALEAMHAGAAVVVSRCGALADVVGDAGSVVDQHDRHGLCEAVRGLVADDEGRRALGKRAAASASERYAPRVVAAALVALWDEVATSR